MGSYIKMSDGEKNGLIKMGKESPFYLKKVIYNLIKDLSLTAKNHRQALLLAVL
ncbi:MAG: hypothetical protein ACI9ES_003547 [Oceanospirillaceae bacterium]|jgi:hypothetical protein